MSIDWSETWRQLADFVVQWHEPALASFQVAFVVLVGVWLRWIRGRLNAAIQTALDAAEKGRNAMAKVDETRHEVRRITDRFEQSGPTSWSEGNGNPTGTEWESNGNDNTVIKKKRRGRTG